MSLLPMRGEESAARHTLKHYFSLRERFFDVTGDAISWLAAWNDLRAAGLLDEDGPIPGAPLAAVGRAAADLDQGRRTYFAAAVVAHADACARAEVRPSGYDGRRSFLGRAGVVVITTSIAEGDRMITCYRVVPRWLRTIPRRAPGPWERAALAKVTRLAAATVERTTVRRARRPAFFLAALPQVNP